MKINLSSRQVKAIKALLSNPTIKASAAESGTPLRTLERWLTESNFQIALRETQNKAIDNIACGLISLQSDALEAMKDVMERPSQPGAATKLKAANEILRLAKEYRMTSDDEDRIERLEEKAHI